MANEWEQCFEFGAVLKELVQFVKVASCGVKNGHTKIDKKDNHSVGEHCVGRPFMC